MPSIVPPTLHDVLHHPCELIHYGARLAVSLYGPKNIPGVTFELRMWWRVGREIMMDRCQKATTEDVLHVDERRW